MDGPHWGALAGSARDVWELKSRATAVLTETLGLCGVAAS
jgi:hypothetical protein